MTANLAVDVSNISPVRRLTNTSILTHISNHSNYQARPSLALPNHLTIGVLGSDTQVRSCCRLFCVIRGVDRESIAYTETKRSFSRWLRLSLWHPIPESSVRCG